MQFELKDLFLEYKCLDQMYAEVCAYLTSNKYFELPTYRVRYHFSFFNN